MKIICRILICLSVISLCSCVRDIETKTVMLTESFHPKNKNIFVLSNNYTSDLRLVLAEHGFKVAKWASPYGVLENVSNKETRVYNKASARYGVSIDTNVIDSCLISNGVRLNINAEIIDVDNNEVIAVIKAGGWTEECNGPGGDGGLVFDELATEMDALWGQ